MPTILRRKTKRHKEGLNIDIAKIYNSSKWKKLRDSYFMYHPLCEMCLKQGETTPTDEIHHIRPIRTGKDITEMRSLAYDPCNLMALCTECHHKVHNNFRYNNERRK